MFGTGWAWQYTPYTLLLVAAGSIMATISGYSWRNRDVTGATSFAVLVGATALWAFSYALQLAGANESTTAFWANLNHVGVAVVPVAWVVFALQFSSRERWLTRRVVTALSIVPVVYLGFVWTNQYHHLVRAPINLQPVSDSSIVVSQHEFGSVFWIHTAYGYLLMLVGILLLMHLLLWSPTVYRRQVALLIFGALLAAGTNALFHTGLTPAPSYLDLTPFSFAIAGVIFFVAIYQYRLFDLNPIARPVIVDTLQDGVIVLDPDSRILDMNETARELLGIGSPEAIGQELRPLLPEESRFVDPTEFDSIRETEANSATTSTDQTASMKGIPPLVSRESKPDEFPIESELVFAREGASVHLQCTSTPVTDVGGKTLGWSVVVRDVTETRHLQQEIEEIVVELRQSNEELDSFAGIISHDLREPLRTTERYLSLLEKRQEGSLNGEQAELLAVAKENAERAQLMIDDLLTYSRIDSEPATFETVDCNQLVSDVLTALQFEIDDRNAAIDVGELPTVYGVDHLLRRLVQNLITNSLEYAGEEPPEIEISGTRSEDTATLTVSDSGVGIESANTDHVFDLFNRGGRPKDGDGTGMGLAICEKIVDVHQGTIALESKTGDGTTITITLPVGPPSAEERHNTNPVE